MNYQQGQIYYYCPKPKVNNKLPFSFSDFKFKEKKETFLNEYILRDKVEKLMNDARQKFGVTDRLWENESSEYEKGYKLQIKSIKDLSFEVIEELTSEKYIIFYQDSLDFIYPLKSNSQLLLDYPDANPKSLFFNVEQIVDCDLIDVKEFLPSQVWIESRTAGLGSFNFFYSFSELYELPILKNVELASIQPIKNIEPYLPSIQLIINQLNNSVITSNSIVDIPLFNGYSSKFRVFIEGHGRVNSKYTKLKIIDYLSLNCGLEEVHLLSPLPEADWVERWFGDSGADLEKWLLSICNSKCNQRHKTSFVLLTGSTGVGKSLLMTQLSKALKFHLFRISAYKLMKCYENMFEELNRKMNALEVDGIMNFLLIENVSEVFNKKDPWVGLDFLRFIKKGNFNGKWNIILEDANTTDIDQNILDAINFKFELKEPSLYNRQNILYHYISTFDKNIDTQNIFNKFKEIAEACSGYLISDLKLLAILLTDKKKSIFNFDSNISWIELFNLVKHHIRLPQLKVIEQLNTKDKISLDMVFGASSIKKELLNQLTLTPDQLYVLNKHMLTPSIGSLVYGPPGTGKTLLAKALATTTNMNFISIRISDIVKGEIGLSEKKLKEIFNRAKRVAPTLIFLDELDGLFSGNGYHQSRLIKAFKAELDGLKSNFTLNQSRIYLIATTNFPTLIDHSILTSGRIDQHFHLSVPSFEERKQLIAYLLNTFKIHYPVHHQVKCFDDLVSFLAKNTDRYTGADLQLFRSGANRLAKTKVKYQNDKNNQEFDLDVDDILYMLPNELIQNVIIKNDFEIKSNGVLKVTRSVTDLMINEFETFKI